ncbi:multidrug efflux pump, putative [Plasmodium ovale curtisi]|uniref:Multidrug efflux pump, putative n=1 Tax=Plasmodium ovale curtisi TaxID=864141 RepID=A0A1A8WND2_PLAOA|nr:multidrug efflux pump, putative [Plasmodium ovale curtisi]
MRWYTRQDYYSPWTDQSTLNSSNHLDGGYSENMRNDFLKVTNANVKNIFFEILSFEMLQKGRCSRQLRWQRGTQQRWQRGTHYGDDGRAGALHECIRTSFGLHLDFYLQEVSLFTIMNFMFFMHPLGFILALFLKMDIYRLRLLEPDKHGCSGGQSDCFPPAKGVASVARRYGEEMQNEEEKGEHIIPS